MATPRLPFLYPNLFRAIRSCEPTTRQSLRTPPATKCSPRASLHTSHRRAQEAFQERYGPATEGRLPPPPKPKDGLAPMKSPEPKKENQAPSSAAEKPKSESEPQHEDPATKEKEENDVQGSTGEEDAKKSPVEDLAPLANKALDSVLQVSPSTAARDETHKNHPHLAPSPYEHHFDTYSLVQELANDGFTQAQSVTIMKAIRSMLAVNLDLAKEGLVSKSDVENEMYLFRAACSELRTTLQTSRHSEMQRQRSQRAHLQHEADILNQRMTQELMGLREDMKAMFHNRKMAVQEEKSKLDGKISELNYEITVLLNSDSKSEVEGLRWVLTRRAAMTIAMSALMILAALNYSSIVSKEREEVKKKKAAAEKAESAKAETRYTTPSRTHGTQTDGPSYEESLG